MTVCIAAISHPLGIAAQVIGVTDSMLTAGDIEFEPPQSKIWRVNRSAFCMIAGDTDDQAEIFMRATSELNRRGEFHPAQIATEYAKQFAAYRAEKAEIAILRPLGLSLKTFVKHQRSLNPDFVARIHGDLLDCRLECEAIIAGTDSANGHIYVVSDPGHVAYHSPVGFAAIGLGSNHAESHFMFSKYHNAREMAEALLLSYTAKKRAEAAPSVGTMTFVSVVTGGLTYEMDENHPVVKALDEKYQEAKAKYEQIEREGYIGIRDAIEQMHNQASHQPTQGTQEQVPSKPLKPKRTPRKSKPKAGNSTNRRVR